MQAGKLVAIPAIQVISAGFNDCEFNQCVFMEVEISNGSKEALSGILIGLSTAPSNGTRPLSYARQEKVAVDVSPGEKRTQRILFVPIEFSKHPICIKVLDVKFAAGAAPMEHTGPTVVKREQGVGLGPECVASSTPG